MRVWVSSESTILAEALTQFLAHLGFESFAERTPHCEVALWHLEHPALPYPAPPALPTLALTSNEADSIKLLQRGYRGHLDASASVQALKHALEAVHRGEIWANRGTVAQALEALTSPKLTAREAEILTLVSEGLPNRTIAARLGITERTVKTHMSNLFEKFRVKSRVELALHASPYGAH